MRGWLICAPSKSHSPPLWAYLKTGADQEVHQDRLQLGLARFEVIPSNENLSLDSQLDDPRDESVLRGPVDVGAAFQDAGHSKQCGRRHLQTMLVKENKPNQ